MLTDLYICDYIRKLDLRRILTDYGFKGDSLFYMCQFTILQAMRKEFNGTNPKHWNINKNFKNIEDFIIKNLINYFPGIVCFISKTGESFIKVSSAYFYLTMFFLKMHMNTRFNLLRYISEKREKLQLFYCILSLKFKISEFKKTLHHWNIVDNRKIIDIRRSPFCFFSSAFFMVFGLTFLLFELTLLLFGLNLLFFGLTLYMHAFSIVFTLMIIGFICTIIAIYLGLITLNLFWSQNTLAFTHFLHMKNYLWGNMLNFLSLSLSILKNKISFRDATKVTPRLCIGWITVVCQVSMAWADPEGLGLFLENPNLSQEEVANFLRNNAGEPTMSAKQLEELRENMKLCSPYQGELNKYQQKIKGFHDILAELLEVRHKARAPQVHERYFGMFNYYGFGGSSAVDTAELVTRAVVEMLTRIQSCYNALSFSCHQEYIIFLNTLFPAILHVYPHFRLPSHDAYYHFGSCELALLEILNRWGIHSNDFLTAFCENSPAPHRNNPRWTAWSPNNIKSVLDVIVPHGVKIPLFNYAEIDTMAGLATRAAIKASFLASKTPLSSQVSLSTLLSIPSNVSPSTNVSPFTDVCLGSILC